MDSNSWIFLGAIVVAVVTVVSLRYIEKAAALRLGPPQDSIPPNVQALIDRVTQEMQTRHNVEIADLRAHYEALLGNYQRKISELEIRVDWLFGQLVNAGVKVPPMERAKSQSKPPVALGVWPESDLDIRGEMDAIYRSGLRYEPLDSNVTKGRILAVLRRVKPEILHVGAHATRDGIMLDDGLALVGWWRSITAIHPFRLVVLNACESLEIVEAMYDTGALSVVGMSKEIADSVAVAFAKEFYDLLLGGLGVEEAAYQAKLTLAHTDAERIAARGDWRVKQ